MGLMLRVLGSQVDVFLELEDNREAGWERMHLAHAIGVSTDNLGHLPYKCMQAED